MYKMLETQIHESRELLQNPYAYLNSDGGYGPIPPIDLALIIERKIKDKRRHNREIESAAQFLQEQLRLHRSEICSEQEFEGPSVLLDPFVALNGIGYRTETVESLGEHRSGGVSFEVAGLIDRLARVVRISSKFSSLVGKFTAAHELGHAVLHEGIVLHRDRALDGTPIRGRRGRTEFEADKFATYFLMPAQLVRTEFERRFKAPQFVVNQGTAFALGAEDLGELRTSLRNVRDLSRLLAESTYYNGEHFIKSLSKYFGVSVGAMAIRLEELDLVRLK